MPDYLCIAKSLFSLLQSSSPPPRLLMFNVSCRTLLSSVEIGKEICLITVGLTEANVATVLAGWLSK